MTSPRKQVGIRVWALRFTLLGLFLAGFMPSAMAGKPVYQRTEEVREPLSLDDLIPDSEDLPDLLPPGPITNSPERPKSEPVSKKEAVKKTVDMVVDKTETPSEKVPEEKPTEPKKAETPEPPKPTTYRVYSTPVINGGADAVPPPVIEPSQVKTQPRPLASNLLPMLAASAIGNQFFPILPLNAAPETVPQLLPVASNLPLAEQHTEMTRAIIFVHDLSRNANEGVALLTTLAGGYNDNTLILAPQFPLGVDVARFGPHLPDEGRNIARWSLVDAQRSGWQSGGDSVATAQKQGISSFTAIDLLLMYLADRERFPQLQQIVVVGHGMGADFVQRYAAAGQAPDILAEQNLTVRFLVANASSYLYLTPARPAGDHAGFVLSDAKQCTDVDNYPYGLNMLVPYVKRIGANAIKLRYPERRVMYLLSDKITDDTFLDQDCAAIAQGRNRLERGQNYERYLLTSFGEVAHKMQSFTRIPNAAYDPVALFGSYCGMAMLFEDGVCPSTMVGVRSENQQ